MKIAVDVRSLMEGRLSGVEEYTINLLEALTRLDPRHEWHLFYNSWQKVSLPPFRGNVHIHGFHWPNKIFNAMQLALTQPRWDMLLRGMDLFFVPNMRLMPLSKRTPMVVTAHDLSFVRFPEFYSWQRRIWHQAMTPRTLFKRANRVIAVSQATAWDLEELYGIKPSKVRVVHSGVKSGVVVGDKGAAVKKKYKLPDNFWLFLGVREPRKNIQALVQAYEIVATKTTSDLVIAGSSGWLGSKLQEMITNSPVRHRIHIPGFIAEEDKVTLYAAADLFIYPSFYEGFGFPPLEAMLAGTPAIISRTGALPEVAGEWATMIDPYNISEIAQVLHEFTEKKWTVSEATKQAISAKYSWDRTARETLAILEEVCE